MMILVLADTQDVHNHFMVAEEIEEQDHHRVVETEIDSFLRKVNK